MTLLSSTLQVLKGPLSHVNRVPLSMQTFAGAGGAFPYGSGTNVQTQLTAYSAVGWLFAVVNRIAEGMAGVEWKLYQKGTGGERTEVDAHPLLDLWRGINPFMTQYEFIEASQQHFELVGESWWLILRTGRGAPVEMWPIRPDRIFPVPDRDQYIKGYIYQIGSERIPLERQDVISIRRPSPLDPYRGIGAVQTIIADLEGERAAALWNRNFFYNSAEPGGIIQLDQELTDQQWESFKMRWREQHQGVANAHRVAILERGKWVDRKFSQRDMEFGALRGLNRDVILGAFGMPKHVLGITEDVNRANAEAGEVIFARWVLRPRLVRLRQTLNERLCPQFGPGLELDFIDPTPANRELERIEAVDGYRYGVLTHNEARRRLGEDSLPDGDSVYQPPAPAVPAHDHEPSSGGTSPPPKALTRGATLATLATIELPASVAAGEAAMQRAWAKRLSAECDALVSFLEQFKAFPSATTKIEVSDLAGYDWDWWQRHGDEVMAELLASFEAAFAAAAPELGPTEAQHYAIAYARERAGELLKLDGDVSVAAETKLRVQELVADTIANGDSLQTLQRSLRNDLAFSRQRAESVARTETATALGHGEYQAAALQGRDQKHWVTQGDDHVESQCRNNAAAGWIGINQAFPGGVQFIPQHPWCRCRTTYRTSALHEGISRQAVLSEVHCPGCDRRLPVNNLAGTADLFCKRCNKTYTIDPRVLTTPI